MLQHCIGTSTLQNDAANNKSQLLNRVASSNGHQSCNSPALACLALSSSPGKSGPSDRRRAIEVLCEGVGIGLESAFKGRSRNLQGAVAGRADLTPRMFTTTSMPWEQSTTLVGHLQCDLSWCASAEDSMNAAFHPWIPVKAHACWRKALYSLYNRLPPRDISHWLLYTSHLFLCPADPGPCLRQWECSSRHWGKSPNKDTHSSQFKDSLGPNILECCLLASFLFPGCWSAKAVALVAFKDRVVLRTGSEWVQETCQWFWCLTAPVWVALFALRPSPAAKSGKWDK